MKVTCPGCNWSADVPDEKIPVEGRKGTCPKCQTKFDVKRIEKPVIEQVPITSPTTRRDTKPCPLCGEEILSAAKKCKHCTSMLEGSSPETQKVDVAEMIPKAKEKFKLTALEIIGSLIIVITVIGGVSSGNLGRAISIMIAFCIAVFIKRKLVADYNKRPAIAIMISSIIFIIITGVAGSVFQTDNNSQNTPKTSQATVPTVAKAEDITDEPAFTQVTADDFYTTYAENEVAADNMYKGKIIQTMGHVDSVGSSNNTIFVYLKAGQFNRIKCIFGEKHRNELSSLNKDDVLFLKGRCVGKQAEVVLQDCSIIPVR